jgi:hypothetical protein
MADSIGQVRWSWFDDRVSSDRMTTLGSAMVDVSVHDPQTSRQAYERLLGVGHDHELSVNNGCIQLSEAPETAHRALFAAPGFDATTRLLRRRGLSLRETRPGWAESGNEPSVGVVAETVLPPASADSEITSIDHLVFNAVHRDSAVALFAGALGMDFRLEQAIHDRIHQLFFRSSALVVEVVVGQLAAGDESATTLWGIAWRSDDIALTHERLSAHGMALSDIRIGRKPGTSVFSVREPALGLPTLVIG